jgi:hypothetical protein|tara:strand:- start:204 stop:1091 length:888 start_codon:yes stop_codon:yes gene_type:complete
MNQLVTIDTNNYAAMAKAMGIANEGSSSSSSSLARMRINHSPIMGTAEVKGKNVNVEVVEGGTYKLEIPDGPTFFSPNVKFRPFMQRFMYKRFVKGSDTSPNRYIKTLMSDNLNLDLKDNDGGFNCGKPAGYIKDFKALPEKTQELIRQIKRVRVVFGTVEMLRATNEKGEEAEVDVTPFIWEIDNRDAFKEVGGSFETLAKMQRLPIQHMITANTQERKIPTGASFYVPQVSLDLSNTIQLTDEDQALFGDFISWIDNYNNYILNSWSEKTNSKMDEEDEDVVEGLVDIEIDED